MLFSTSFVRAITCTCILVLVCSTTAVSGKEVVPFNRANSGLIDNHVNALSLFQGAPLVATSKGVSWRQTDRWENFRAGENGLPDAPVTCAVVFSGNLWLGTFGKGLARLTENKWKSFSQTDSGLNDDFVTCLAGWGTRLVVGTREGVSIFDGMLWNRIPLAGVTGAIQITSLAIGRDVLLVGTAQGLFFVDAELKSRQVDLGISPAPWVQALAVGNELLFVGHDAGLAVLQNDGRQAMNGYDRAQVGRIFNLGVLDRDVLCATNHGLIRVSPGAGVNRVSLPEFGIAGLGISALLESGGDWYLGTSGHGVFRVPADRLVSGGGVQLNSSLPTLAGSSSSGLVSDTGNGSSIKLVDLRVFPPPPVSADTESVSRPSLVRTEPDAVPFWTLHKRPPKPSNLSYFKDVLPMIVKKCLACHTTGTGKYFPLNDPRVVTSYFRKAGMDRFDQFSAEGNGMFGMVSPEDYDVLNIWVMEGCKD